MLVYLLSGLSFFGGCVCSEQTAAEHCGLRDSWKYGLSVKLLTTDNLRPPSHTWSKVFYKPWGCLSLKDRKSCCLEWNILASLASLGKIRMFSFSTIFHILTLWRLFLECVQENSALYVLCHDSGDWTTLKWKKKIEASSIAKAAFSWWQHANGCYNRPKLTGCQDRAELIRWGNVPAS